MQGQQCMNASGKSQPHIPSKTQHPKISQVATIATNLPFATLPLFITQHV